jgi:hypothetical protein
MGKNKKQTLAVTTVLWFKAASVKTDKTQQSKERNRKRANTNTWNLVSTVTPLSASFLNGVLSIAANQLMFRESRLL